MPKLMRIVIVSAHYPPDFVSGATLQAQRLARGALEAGHDVAVYAGWIGGGVAERLAEHEPLSCWEEVDERGVRVRWVSTAAWLGWDDRGNFDNSEVAADFNYFLESFSPDIVHFQVLQTMGALLVPKAAEFGARVVVTMHDFWWLCTRLFLVDNQLVPCSLVVEAGVCSCEVDREWMQERKAFLQRALEPVELILAPSTTAAAVLAANGIGGDRLVVDENGVDRIADSSRSVSEDQHELGSEQPLRLVYAGGREPLKGWEVLRDAARILADDLGTSGWQIVAYGVVPIDEEESALLASMGIVARAAFDPKELDSVLSHADVLLLPSIMRETFSIITREALAGGVPVICTDSIGPEEIVEHGHNGLIVATGDSPSLASAIAEILTQPGLLSTMRENAGLVSMRSVQEQVAGILGHYERLVGGTVRSVDGASITGVDAQKPDLPSQTRANAQGVSRRRTLRRVLFVCGIQGAPLRYRARLPAEALDLVGITSDVRHYRDPELGILAARADVIVVYRVPGTPQILEVIRRARSLGTPVLFDVDDLIFDPELASEIPALSLLESQEAELWMEGVRRYRTTMESCDGFIASTQMLAQHAGATTGLPTYRFDNGVGVVIGADSDAAVRAAFAGGHARKHDVVRIAYLSGTNTHTHDWAMVEPAVLEIMNRHVGTELWLIGEVEPTEALEAVLPRVRCIGPQHWRSLPALLAEVDINLAPLVGQSRFNEAKSAIKWLEAALVGIPTIASGTEPFVTSIRHGINGLIADDSGQWLEHLEALVSDQALRSRLGGRARRDALLGWSPHLQARRYERILRQAMDLGPLVGRDITWEAVVRDEPLEPGHTLEPYPGPKLVAAMPIGAVEVLGPEAEGPGGAARPVLSWRPRAAEATERRIPRMVSITERGLTAWAERGTASVALAALRKGRGALSRRRS